MPRVHCDYTEGGAPRRLQQLGEEGIFSKLRGRTLTPAEAAALAAGRFAFINVWRSIDEEHPVLQPPPYTYHGLHLFWLYLLCTGAAAAARSV